MKLRNSNVIFRQLQEQVSSTFTYLLACAETRQSVIIDPVFQQVTDYETLRKELDFKPFQTSLETHVHADHLTGGHALRRRFPQTKFAISAASNASNADVLLSDGDVIRFGNHQLEARSTPGHTDGCMSFVLDDQLAVFTGDTLLIRGTGRTDFQQGSAETLARSIREKLFSLGDDCLVFPGHDYHGRTMSTIGEEKNFNPRINANSNEVDVMKGLEMLHLPHPKMMDVAVPFNVVCGVTDKQNPAEERLATWGDIPVYPVYGGGLEIMFDDLMLHQRELRIIDVREEDEVGDPHLAALPGSSLVPLGGLVQYVQQLDAASQAQPIVLVCRSGVRSARGCQMLESIGIEKVANLKGGLILNTIGV